MGKAQAYPPKYLYKVGIFHFAHPTNSVKSLSNKNAVLPNAYTDKNLSALNTATYSINYIQQIFKAKLVNEYNNDYKNSQSKNNIFFQDEPEQQSIFEGNNKARGFRKYKGAYMPAENIIEFFKGADESTIVHELIKKDKQILQKKSMTNAILFFYIVIILILLLVPVPEELLLQSILYRKLLFPE